MKTILSFGGGVNSMALLCLKLQGKVEFDEIVFSDTGSEMPETYKYIEDVVKPLCIEYNIPFHVVGSKNLYMDYFTKKIIPYRLFRSCTDRYKIKPIHKFCKSRFTEYETIIGIDSGESKRAKAMEGVSYPLIDLGIDREGCKRIIKDCGFKAPVKSGCFFCPFMRITEWKNLYENHKDLFLKAEEFEKNCRAYPKYTLTKIKLEQLRKAIETQTKLFEGNPENIERCIFCHT